MDYEKLTELIRRSINILMVANPINTSLGILIGIMTHGLIGLFSPLLSSIEYINIQAIKLWHLISGGVVIMNLPSFLKRKKVDESITEAISYIEEQKSKGNIQEWQAKQMYANLHNKVLENVILNQAENETARRIQDLFGQSDNAEK